MIDAAYAPESQRKHTPGPPLLIGWSRWTLHVLINDQFVASRTRIALNRRDACMGVLLSILVLRIKLRGDLSINFTRLRDILRAVRT